MTPLVVLIVERNPLDAGSYVRALRRRGHRVDWTPILQEARFFLSDFAYDVVLLDEEVREWGGHARPIPSVVSAWSLRDECGGLAMPPRVVLMAHNPRESGPSPDFCKTLESYVRLVDLVEGR